MRKQEFIDRCVNNKWFEDWADTTSNQLVFHDDGTLFITKYGMTALFYIGQDKTQIEHDNIASAIVKDVLGKFDIKKHADALY